MQDALLVATELSKIYSSSAGAFPALSGVSLTARSGEFITIVGKSGSGKSTLINLVAGIDRATSGSILIDGNSIAAMDERKLARWRGKNIGVVFQFFQLLPTLTIAENIMLPMDFCNQWPAGQRRVRALGLLERVGILEQADKFPAALSGGQQQRAAIARAIANDPKLIVADEPTGNLDSQTATEVFQLFSGLVAEGKTILMVTHERDLSAYASREILLADGRLVQGEAIHV